MRKNKLNYEDTTSREKYLERVCAPERVEVLNVDYPSLFSALITHSKEVPIPLAEGEKRSFAELMRYQPLLILERINSYSKEEIDLMEINTLLRYHPQTRLSKAVQELLKSDLPAGEQIDLLRSHYREFRDDIEQAGITDPALATVDTFLRNYIDIASGFNKIWERIPEFYIKHILNKMALPPRPDEAWLTVKKREDFHDIVIPAQTLFCAGINRDGSDFCYHSKEETTLTGIYLHSVSSVIFRQSELLVGDHIVRYVDNILQKEIEPDGKGEAVALFESTDKGAKGSSFVTTGMVIESPMLLLEGGERDLFIELFLTEDSVLFFEEYVSSFTGLQNEFIDDYYRLLEDAFYLEISTENGWENIPHYELKYKKGENGRFVLHFRLGREFPSTAACNEKHRCITGMPALRILINRKARIFPYSWARKIFFNKLKISCDARQLPKLELVNEQGIQDINSSFQPFGVRGERGSWFLAGNYEAAVKPLREVSLHIKWSQLPQETGGLETYYQGYNLGIRNDSFRVKTEYLKGKEWVDSSPHTTALFRYNRKSEMVEEEQTITWELDGKMPVNTLPKEEFRYGSATTGFFRIRLDEPRFGFGYSLYQNLLINRFLIRKKREKIELLNEPYIPVIDSIEFGYQAQESIDNYTGKQSRTKLYHIDPVDTRELQPVTDRIFPLVKGIAEEGCLKLAFGRARSYDKIRIYVELIPSCHEFEKEEISKLKWYYHNGIEWKKIEEEHVYDETDNFLNSGIIEIELPMRISEMHLDREELFRIYAAFERNHLNYPSLFGIYTNIVKVEAVVSDHPERHSGTEVLPSGSIKRMQKPIPGITSVEQPRQSRGGVGQEIFNDIYFRTSNQILFRGMPVTPGDYERLTLELFPQVGKVKCFPACDAKNNGRKGVVTLAVMQKKEDNAFPLCSYDLLFEIEKKIGQYAGPFVLIDAINPVFEEVMVRCFVKLKPGTSANRFQKEMKVKIDNYISPWLYKKELPEFGRTLKVADIRSLLEEETAIEEIHRVSLIILMTSTRKARIKSQTIRKVLEFSDEKAYVPIKTSHPWYICIPAKEHHIYTSHPEEHQKRIGIGDMKVDSTLVIK